MRAPVCQAGAVMGPAYAHACTQYPTVRVAYRAVCIVGVSLLSCSGGPLPEPPAFQVRAVGRHVRREPLDGNQPPDGGRAADLGMGLPLAAGLMPPRAVGGHVED